jgi:hypothetical protein
MAAHLPPWIRDFIAEHGLHDLTGIPSPVRGPPDTVGGGEPILAASRQRWAEELTGAAAAPRPQPRPQWVPTPAAQYLYRLSVERPVPSWMPMSPTGKRRLARAEASRKAKQARLASPGQQQQACSSTAATAARAMRSWPPAQGAPPLPARLGPPGAAPAPRRAPLTELPPPQPRQAVGALALSAAASPPPPKPYVLQLWQPGQQTNGPVPHFAFPAIDAAPRPLRAPASPAHQGAAAPAALHAVARLQLAEPLVAPAAPAQQPRARCGTDAGSAEPPPATAIATAEQLRGGDGTLAAVGTFCQLA